MCKGETNQHEIDKQVITRAVCQGQQCLVLHCRLQIACFPNLYTVVHTQLLEQAGINHDKSHILHLYLRSNQRLTISPLSLKYILLQICPVTQLYFGADIESERNMVCSSVKDRKHEPEQRNAFKKQLLFLNMLQMMNYGNEHYKTLLQMTLSHFHLKFLVPQTLLFALAL